MPRGPPPKESTPVSPHLSHYTLTHSMPEMPSTPAPTKARINHLESQISELVRRSHAVERKHKSEIGGYVDQIEKLKKELKEGEAWKVKAGEMEKIKAEGEAMREEVGRISLFSHCYVSADDSVDTDEWFPVESPLAYPATKSTARSRQ